MPGSDPASGMIETQMMPQGDPGALHGGVRSPLPDLYEKTLLYGR
jgi:hypothetical protein